MDKKQQVILAVVASAIIVISVIAVAVLYKPSSSSTTVYYDSSITVPNMGAALATGLVDGFISWEPFVTDAVEAGTGDVLMWSSEIMPNHPCCVVVGSTNFLGTADGPELAKRFLKAHMDATEWMVAALEDKTSANYNLLVTLAEEFTLRNASVVSGAMTHLRYTYEMNDTFKSAIEQFTDMYLELNLTTNETMESMGYTSVGDFVGKYVNDSLLSDAAEVQPSDTILGTVRLGYLVGDIHQLAQFVANDPRVLGGEQSMFEKYGLDVVPAAGAPYANGGAEMDAFVAGDVDIGYLGAPPAIIKHLNGGAKTTILAQVNIEGSGLVVAKDSGIASIDDLVNKTISVPGTSTIQFLLLKIELERHGYDLAVKPS